MDLGDLGRFSEPGLRVLVSLASGPKHGWLIAEEIEAQTGRRPQPATLYGAISRLEASGLIRALEQDGRRHPFAITSSGRQVLEARLEDLAGLVREGRRALAVRTA